MGKLECERISDAEAESLNWRDSILVFGKAPNHFEWSLFKTCVSLIYQQESFSLEAATRHSLFRVTTCISLIAFLFKVQSNLKKFIYSEMIVDTFHLLQTNHYQLI